MIEIEVLEFVPAYADIDNRECAPNPSYCSDNLRYATSGLCLCDGVDDGMVECIAEQRMAEDFGWAWPQESRYDGD